MGRSLGIFYSVLVIVFGLVLTCNATTYTVGDYSGWDISTDLDTWQDDKRFVVGDVLSFQYSSSDTVNEVIKESYDGCNTTNFIESYSTGNTSITLTNPGDRYFISGNKFFCSGGMKLHAHVNQDQSLSLAGPGRSLPTTNRESDEPNSTILNSGIDTNRGLVGSFVSVILAFVSVLFVVV